MGGVHPISASVSLFRYSRRRERKLPRATTFTSPATIGDNQPHICRFRQINRQVPPPDPIAIRTEETMCLRRRQLGP